MMTHKHKSDNEVIIKVLNICPCLVNLHTNTENIQQEKNNSNEVKAYQKYLYQFLKKPLWALLFVRSTMDIPVDAIPNSTGWWTHAAMKQKLLLILKVTDIIKCESDSADLYWH